MGKNAPLGQKSPVQSGHSHNPRLVRQVAEDRRDCSSRRSAAGPEPNAVLPHPGRGRARWSLDLSPREQHFQR